MSLHRAINILLLPFSAIYGLVTTIRNLLFQAKVLPQKQAPQYVIAVGNLTLGGTGKTPVTEYLVRELQHQFKLAILSRGYGRKTKGFHWATPTSTTRCIGDEPMQFYEKFSPGVVVAVSENRFLGATKIQETHSKVQIIILDDAYQHRSIQRDINILLNDYNRPFYEDYPVPGGRLRERRRGANRADIVLVTKCPTQLTGATKLHIKSKIHKYCAADTPIVFAGIKYGAPSFLINQGQEIKKVLILTGIAAPETFIQELNKRYTIIGTKTLPDHYNYTETDVKELIRNLKSNTFVLTTEKDFVKLRPLVMNTPLANKIAYIPIEVDFGPDKNTFDQFIQQKLDQIK